MMRKVCPHTYHHRCPEARTMVQKRLRWTTWGTVGVLAALACLLGPLPGRAQPPGYPGGPSYPGNPYPGNMPRPPGIPNPPSFGPPAGGGGFTGGFGGVDEWYCTGCNRVLGTGPVKPSYSRCPFCGVKFINGGPDMGAPFAPGMAPPGGYTPPPGGYVPPPATAPPPN